MFIFDLDRVRFDSRFECGNLLHRSEKPNGEIDGILHVWTSEEIADGFCGQHGIWVVNFFVVKSEKHGVENIHLFDDHLDSIDHTSVSDVIWMHHEYKDNSFEHGLACVPKHESHQHQLRR